MSNRSGEKTEFGPGKTPLYYYNNGLFSDLFLEDRLPNLEKYYNNPSTRFLNDYWNINESNPVKYNEAFQQVMNLWNKLDQNVPKYCSKERQVQNSWIDPIFRILGWEIELEEASSKNGVTNFPDYALFASLDDWKKSKNLSGNNKFKKATAIADAKDWGVSLDGKGFSNKNPSFQIVNYLKQTDKNWGVLTDGKYWRIYSLRSDSKHTTFYEIDLEKILASGDFERFKYFYNFFRVEAFVVDAKLNDRSFLDFVFEDGKFYAQLIDKNLNERVYKVVNTICQGYLSNYLKPSEQELKEIYSNSMYYLFKLMFILNCESKGLLEVNKQDDYYEFSLRKKCLELKEQVESGKNWSSQPRTYNFINDLFDLLKSGDQKIGVHGFGNEPFEVGNKNFYIKNKIGDDILNNALLELSCDRDEEGQLQFIDYKILSPDHIGSLFEGLLEFNLVREENKIELVNNKGERKSTGSYYTPDFLVDYIVEETLRTEVENKSPSEILKLKIIDPAMGSGHFLLGVVKYLENEIVKIQNTDKKVNDSIEFDKIRKEVLKNCVFGVDINPLATQLAKFSLWIYSSQKGDNLEALSDQLVCFDSLCPISLWKEKFAGHKISSGFDAVVGNPPYIGEKGNKELFRNALKNNADLETISQGKMDYFYFFLFQGIEMLKKNGSLGFITTAYWRTADGAKKLRSYLSENATISKWVDLGKLTVFESAKGQHNLIQFFKKGSTDRKFQFMEYTGTNTELDKAFENRLNWKIEELKWNSQHFNSSPWLFNGNDSTQIFSNDTVKLGDIYHVGCGVRTTADTLAEKKVNLVSKSDILKKDIKKGSGIFVLNAEEYKSLKKTITKKELDKIKPWYKNSDIQMFKNIKNKDLYVVYLTNKDNPKDFPNLIKHLETFKSVLNFKKENYEEENVWYAVNRASEDSVLKKEKIVTPYRSTFNRFSYTNEDLFGSMDLYYITYKNENSIPKLTLKALATILNSPFYNEWCKKNLKRKGNIIEFYATPLKSIILPNPKLISVNNIKLLESLYDELSELNVESKIFEQKMSRVDALVRELFAIKELAA